MIANSVAAGALAVSFCTCAAALMGRSPARLMPIYSWSGFHWGGHASGETADFRRGNLRSRLGIAADT